MGKRIDEQRQSRMIENKKTKNSDLYSIVSLLNIRQLKHN